MNRYNTFLCFFIITVVAFIFFMAFYLNVILGIILHAPEYPEADPFRVVRSIFGPGIIISGIGLFVSSLIYRVLGIVSSN